MAIYGYVRVSTLILSREGELLKHSVDRFKVMLLQKGFELPRDIYRGRS